MNETETCALSGPRANFALFDKKLENTLIRFTDMILLLSSALTFACNGIGDNSVLI